MKKTALLPLFLLLLFLTSCSGRGNRVSIAQQYGLAYAPVQIMKEKGFLEEELGGNTTVQWLKLANTAAIREGVLAGDVDAGFLGIPPFLIALDQGMPWKLLCGVSRSPLGLVVPAGQWSSLNDLPDDVRLALPQPGSIQHILLTMAVKRERGQAGALDRNLVSLKHPDGLNALTSGSVDGHFTSPPYLFMEEDLDDFEVLLSGEEAMGSPFTFIAAMVTDKAASEKKDFPGALKKALERSMQFMRDNPEDSLRILAAAYNLEEAVLQDYMNRPGMVYDTEILGLDQFISFMNTEGYLEQITSTEGILLP
ncbi:MAG: ABC transporter substrate-binding protein [Spirochaetales bacterium]|nr:ABC transporter substrate-binding protein [Spirochaetales bacterium]